MMPNYELVRSDVLIIGAGGAGLRAAIAAADSKVDVVVVAKQSIGLSGITMVAMGGFSAYLRTPDDSAGLHFKEIVESGKYLSDQNVIEPLVSDGLERVLDLEKYGVKFQKEGAEYWRLLIPGTSVPRFLFLKGGGRRLVASLTKIAGQNENIAMYSDIAISRLLISDSRINGAVGLDVKSGVAKVFQCKTLILAAGGAGYLWAHSDCPPESTGDAYSLAYYAGEKVINMEQQLFYPTVAVYPEEIKGQVQPYEILLGFDVGSRLLNRRREEIYPAGKYRTRDSLTHLIARTVNEGQGTPHGGVYLDLTVAPKEKRKEVLARHLGQKYMASFGVNLEEHNIEVAPAAHTTLGGVRIDEEARASDIKGLFACGEAVGNIHGANRLAGHSLLDTQVFGFRAGQNAAELAKEWDWVPVSGEQIEAATAELISLLEPKEDAIAPSGLKKKITNLVEEYLGPIRNKEGLEKLMTQVEALREDELRRVSVPAVRQYNTDWLEAIEVGHMLCCAEMAGRCALIREESRGTHYREDIPYTDDETPVQHTVVQLRVGSMEVSKTPVNLTRIVPPRQKLAPF